MDSQCQNLAAVQDPIEIPSQIRGNSQKRRLSISKRPVYQPLHLKPAAATLSGAVSDSTAPLPGQVAGASSKSHRALRTRRDEHV